MTEAQQIFFKDEVWSLTFGGAFQHNKIYKDNIKDTERESFRENLRSYIESTILPAYKKTLTDEKHRAMILAITENSTLYKSILKNDRLSVGTAQKLLNLALKYYWCLGWLPEPPHFPIDGIIQKYLPLKSRTSWTNIQHLEDYQFIIDCARQQLNEGESLAKWELSNFRRRNSVL